MPLCSYRLYAILLDDGHAAMANGLTLSGYALPAITMGAS